MDHRKVLPVFLLVLLPRLALTRSTSYGKTVTAAGSTAVEQFMRKCVEPAFPGFTYEAVGSTTGISKALTGEVDIGVTDVPLARSENTDGLLRCALLVGAVGVFVNGGGPLNLNACLLAKIYDRRITRWEDPAIKAANPDRSMKGDIVPIGRSDSSGSTQLIATYASTCSSGFELGISRMLEWREGTLTAEGRSGVLDLLANTTGGIAYAFNPRGEPGKEAKLEGPEGSLFAGVFVNTSSASAPLRFVASVITKSSGEDVEAFMRALYSDDLQRCARSLGYYGVGNVLGLTCLSGF